MARKQTRSLRPLCKNQSSKKMIAYVVQGVGYGFVGAAQPGPFQAYIISQALRLGWKRSLSASFAPLISDAPIILLVLLVLSQLPASMQRLLHLASGLFLTYLAWCAWRSWRKRTRDVSGSSVASHRTLLKAALINLLSPGPYAYWGLVAGPTFLTGWRNAPASGIAFLLGFYITLVGTLAAIIIAFGTARQLGPQVTRVMIGLSIVILACFGIYQLWLGIAG